MLKRIKDWDEQMLRCGLYRRLTDIPRGILRFFRWLRRRGLTYARRYWGWKLRVRFPAKEPWVSIIVPVYNAEPYLKQCLESLVNQTMKAIEIIAVDDGSTDYSLEILNQYAAQDSRIRVLRQQNRFAGAARNLGLSQARGEYVMFLDSDDFFERSLAAETYAAGKAGNADVVLFDARRYDDVTRKVDPSARFFFRNNKPDKEPFSYEDCPDTLFQITTPCPWTKLFRREFVQEQGLRFQPIQNANDVYFVILALAAAKRIVTVDKALVYYRVGLTSNIQSNKKKHPFCFYEAYKAVRDWLREQGLLEPLRQSYVNLTLSGSLYNIQHERDPETKRLVCEKIRDEVIPELELAGHEAGYYHNPRQYERLQAILSGDLEFLLE